MKYITLHTGETWFGVIFGVDLRHRTVYETLQRLWKHHPLPEGDDEMFIAPIQAGFVHFSNGFYHTFDRSTTLNLPSNPADGVEIYKDLTSKEGGQFLRLQGGRFIAISKPIFNPEVLRQHNEEVLLGDVKCRPQQGSKHLAISSWVKYVPNERWMFKSEDEQDLARIINCHSPYSLLAGL